MIIITNGGLDLENIFNGIYLYIIVTLLKTDQTLKANEHLKSPELNVILLCFFPVDSAVHVPGLQAFVVRRLPVPDLGGRVRLVHRGGGGWLYPRCCYIQSSHLPTQRQHTTGKELLHVYILFPLTQPSQI